MTKGMIEATADGRLTSNWKTVAVLIGAVFAAGMFYSAKAAALEKIEATANEAKVVASAAANRLDARMAKIEERVGNLEVVTNSMDRKMSTIDTKMDAVMRKYGVPPLVDTK